MSIEVSEIIKRLEIIASRGYDISKVFSDWIDIMFYAFLSQSAFAREDRPIFEAQYLKTINQYKNDQLTGQREVDLFTECLSLLMIQMKATNRELLGEIYESLSQTYKGFGQFFTPVAVCQLIAKILYPTAPKQEESINDPCCGSGRMLIEIYKLHSTGFFVGQDIDLRCVKLTALNFLFFNMNGLIIWGNTLALEQKRAFRTVRSPMGGSIYQISQKEVPALG